MTIPKPNDPTATPTKAAETLQDALDVLCARCDDEEWPGARLAVAAVARMIPGARKPPRTTLERSLAESEDIRDSATLSESWVAATGAQRQVIDLRSRIEEQSARGKRRRKLTSEMSREEYLAQRVDELQSQADAVAGRDIQGHARLTAEVAKARDALDEHRASARPIPTDAELDATLIEGLVRMPAHRRAKILAVVEERTRR